MVTPLYLEHLILVILNVFIFLCRQENFQDRETNTALLRVLSTGHVFCEYTMIYQEIAYVVDNHVSFTLEVEFEFTT